jgi:hypothetical protein
VIAPIFRAANHLGREISLCYQPSKAAATLLLSRKVIQPFVACPEGY